MKTLPIKPSSAYTDSQIRSYLQQAQLPMRLACLNRSHDDHPIPLVASHWFIFDDDEFWCVTHKGSAFCHHLQHSPQCGFEIAADTMPYRGVRGQGIARLEPESGERFLNQLLEKYAVGSASRLGRFLLGRADEEVAIAITPLWLTSWDFGHRMADV